MDGGGEPSCRAAQISIAAYSIFPGFRFSPTDQELISYYLKNKILGSETSVQVVPEIEIWKYEPWELPAKAVIPSESEWFFFSPRGRKYPNGSQSRRATESGYWKATGKEREVKSGSKLIGTKRTLVFHIGRAPKGERTEWIMHEYCTLDKSLDFMVVCRLRKNTAFHAATTTTTPPQAHSDSMDSASESNQKVASEVTQPDHPKVYADGDGDGDGDGEGVGDDDDEDFFAEILKDDIIELDQTLDFPDQKAQQAVKTIHIQGTANRRIKLRKESEENVEAAKTRVWSAKAAAVNRQLIVAVVVVVTLMALSLHLLGVGGLWSATRVMRNSMYIIGFLG